jgi:hypothetical protein
MKVVINNCFGGFSLSMKATKMLAQLKGKDCYFFNSSFKTGDIKYTSAEEEDGLFWTAFTIPNPNEYFSNKDWRVQTAEEREEESRKYRAISVDNRPEDRTDLDLIKVIEILGKEADGGCAELKIVEIPDGVDYQIDEYDGNETIHEKHRSWG